MQSLEVSRAVRPIYGSLGVKRLSDYVFRLPSSVHYQVIRLCRGNYAMYDMVQFINSFISIQT